MENELVQTRNFKILSGFILKILALVFMTIDHTGLCIGLFYGPAVNSPLYITMIVFRIIGRLALPLFAFLLAEGMLHTKNAPRYFLRLGIVGVMIMIAQIALLYGYKMDLGSGNIFIDLVLGGVSIYLLNKKNRYSFIVILPFIYMVGCSAVGILEYTNVLSLSVTSHYFPFYIRAQYGIFSYVLILGFYYLYKFAKYLWKVNPLINNIEFDIYKTTPQYRTLLNILASVLLLGFNLVWYILTVIYPGFDYLGGGLESYSMIAAVFLLFYSGTRGYNAKWFQYGSYLYYPLHIVIIWAIFTLITRL